MGILGDVVEEFISLWYLKSIESFYRPCIYIVVLHTVYTPSVVLFANSHWYLDRCSIHSSGIQRFHELSDSDEAKRSCYIGLSGHIDKCGKIISSPMEKFQPKWKNLRLEEIIAGKLIKP
ncbi:hypothetical protein MKW98_013075 [Papaver atlanticum]|uniref:Uncharacterized protein n=1 Tax=Papaver atlanticum TaxID=357466 RepID=A0AAD4T9J9_9MAGN|nr:hypothetical protein MKW98_013075 [Papaver atlanticum]